MLFNSVQFAIFFPIVTLLYFNLPYRWRGALLLSASCLFYMAFVPVYIGVLFFTIGVDYLAALRIDASVGRQRKAWLIVSVCSTCAVLFVFKYFGFFSDTAALAARSLGMDYAVPALRLILPIGLSFHTFQSLSYVIEVYRRQQDPERDPWRYALYVMFYPQLVAGPIERPQNLLRQLRENHDFEYDRVVAGLQLMAWGMVKKAVVADRLAELATRVFDAPREFTGIPLVIGTVAFAFQIYCDFSGYSDIAIGAAQVMGFRLMRNFDRPYTARSIGEFWGRWHISLSTWFRDYVYVPLGGNRVPRARWLANLFVTFLVSGLWHGARWTFIVWGAFHGTLLILGIVTERYRVAVRSSIGIQPHPGLLKAWQIVSTFTLVSIGWVLFRAQSLGDARYVLSRMPVGALHQLRAAMSDSAARTHDLFLDLPPSQLQIAAAAVLVMLLIEQANGRWPIRSRILAWPAPFRWVAYASIVLSIMTLGSFGNSKFIYFQF
ncbi:MAG: MBOAT family protein [Gemmatimonadaceae bacterium]|nr:MBOAT family protein [Gemmatimonadaceae bacterium]